MVIKRDTIYWVRFPGGGNHEEMRPCLVIQNDVLNESRLNTAIVVAITSVPEFGKLPGNVIIEEGEANMPWRGVVNVTQISSISPKS